MIFKLRKPQNQILEITRSYSPPHAKPWTLTGCRIHSVLHSLGIARWWHCRTSPIYFLSYSPGRYWIHTGTASRREIPYRSSDKHDGVVYDIFADRQIVFPCLSWLLFHCFADIYSENFNAGRNACQSGQTGVWPWESNPDEPEITNYKHHLILKLGQINLNFF